MNLLGSFCFTVADQTVPPGEGTGAAPIVVWLQGDHDLSTDEALSRSLARAIAPGGTGLVLDLNDVAFIAVSTLRVIVRAQQLLHHGSRSLTVRSPSSCARRAISACGLHDLLGPGPEELITELPANEAGSALGSWVEVPAPRQAARGQTTTNVTEDGGG